MNISDAKSIYINGKEIRSIMIDGRMVYEKVNMTLLASKEFIVSDESVSICLESDLKEKEVELFKVIGMTRESMGSKTTGSDGTASWSYTGTGAGLVGFVAVYDDKDSNTVSVDDYTPVVSGIGLVADKSAIISGQSVLLTASVVDQYEQAISSGTVTFKVNGTSVGTGSISGGVATLTTSAFSDGVNQVTAEVGSVSSDIVNVSVVGLALTLGITGDSFSSAINNLFVYTGSVLIDWGDGTIAEYTGEQLTHTYASSGDYEIEIYGNITKINTSSFAHRTNLSSIRIGSSITSIGNSCFSECTGLISVSFAEGITTLDEVCFSRCTSLTSVEIPNSVTSLGSACFLKCTALTELILNWESSSSIVPYISTWILDSTSFDHFLIPQGTTSLYTAKGYPSALLQEQGSVEPDSIDLTGTKSILSYDDREQSVLTATVYDENDTPIEGATVSIYKDNTLWYTATTNASGEISKTYASAGVGDITFEARVAKGSSFVSKTYEVCDALKYVPEEIRPTASYSSYLSRTLSDFSFDGSADYEVEMDFKLSSGGGGFSIAPINNPTHTRHIAFGYNSNEINAYWGKNGASGEDSQRHSKSPTWNTFHHWKITKIGSDFNWDRDNGADTFSTTASWLGTYGAMGLYFYKWESPSMVVKNIKVKPL